MLKNLAPSQGARVHNPPSASKPYDLERSFVIRGSLIQISTNFIKRALNPQNSCDKGRCLSRVYTSSLLNMMAHYDTNSTFMSAKAMSDSFPFLIDGTSTWLTIKCYILECRALHSNRETKPHHANYESFYPAIY